MSDTRKWESLTSKNSTFSYWPVVIVSILIAIGSYFIIDSKKEAPVSKEVVETVLVPEAKPLKAVIDDIPSAEEPTVKAKTFGSKFFEASDEYSEEYDDYSNNMQRDFHSVEKHSSTKFSLDHLKVESADPAKFAEKNGFEATDDFINAWSSENTTKIRESVKIDDEYRMLATEALQSVDTHLKPENAVIVLREILAARTEATRIGAVLPPVPEEQLEAISFWTKNLLTKDLATTILNRV